MRLPVCSKALTIAVVVVAFTVLPALAKEWGRHMGRGWHHYNAAEEVTVKGTVTDVKEVDCSACGFTGTHLMLKTEGESMEVMLGPTSFLKEQKLGVTKGDEVEVTGAKMKVDDEYGLLAREVKMGGETFTLRDERGRPMWAGRRGPRR